MELADQGIGFPNRVYVVTYLRTKGHDWPYDVGDDPSFLVSDRHREDGGVLTWGVCRQDVRNNVRWGDLVIFFTADQLAHRRPARYSFVAFATVDIKVSQPDIWEKPELAVYREYRNLLIRPTNDAGKSGFEHYEPKTNPANWHSDWLWRTMETRGFRKSDMRRASDSSLIEPNSLTNGRPICFAANYLLFCPEGYKTYVLADPPVVAECTRPGTYEEWRTDQVAQDIWQEVLGSSVRQHLRTTNRQQPHRHITISNANIPERLERLHGLCKRHGLDSRSEEKSEKSVLPETRSSCRSS